MARWSSFLNELGFFMAGPKLWNNAYEIKAGISSGIRTNLFIELMDLMRKSAWKSRMTGDCHIRFCEGPEVKFPGPARLVYRPHSGYGSTPYYTTE